MLSQAGLKEDKPHRCADPQSVRACVCVCVLLFNKRNINRLFQINSANPSFLSKLMVAFKHIDSFGGRRRRKEEEGGEWLQMQANYVTHLE